VVTPLTASVLVVSGATSSWMPAAFSAEFAESSAAFLSWDWPR